MQSGNRNDCFNDKTSFPQVTPKNGTGQQPAGHIRKGMPCDVAIPTGMEGNQAFFITPVKSAGKKTAQAALASVKTPQRTESHFTEQFESLIRTVNEGAQFKMAAQTNTKKGNNKASVNRVSLKRI